MLSNLYDDYFDLKRLKQEINKCDNTKVFYHYTSVEALFNIISEKKLRLSYLKSTNDKREMYYSFDDFLIDFDKLISIEQDESILKVFKLLKNSFSSKKKFKDLQKLKPFGMALTTERDNLTHWDRYANNSTGVCLGINVDIFRLHDDMIHHPLFLLKNLIYTDYICYKRKRTFEQNKRLCFRLFGIIERNRFNTNI